MTAHSLGAFIQQTKLKAENYPINIIGPYLIASGFLEILKIFICGPCAKDCKKETKTNAD